MGSRKQKKALNRQQREAKREHVEKCVARAEEVRQREIPLTVSRKEIFAARTPAGGWTRETLSQWGISWPPRSGWIDRLANGIRDEIWDDPDPV